MALCYDITNIKNQDSVCFQKQKLCPNTQSLIWQLYLLRMSELTQENWKEFATRFLITNPYTKQSHYRTQKQYENSVVTAIKKHIGLKVWVDKYVQRIKGKWSDTIIRELHEAVLEDVNAIHEQQERSRLNKNARNRKYRAKKKVESQLQTISHALQ